MAYNAFFLTVVAIVRTLASVTLAEPVPVAPILDVSFLNRSTFPPGFLFGTASAAYQYEGAAKEGGKGPSVWDTFTHKHPELIQGRSNGDVADDQYHLYKEDVGIMKYMNLDAYRFSISWPRILPKGKLSGGINQEGVKYYNNLINELNDFQDYAEVCFKEFGDRVKYWITLNEPWTYTTFGYATGVMPPNRCSKWLDPKCVHGDSGKEPYLVSHHLLLAHAATVQVYRIKYQVYQNGVIGITLVSNWFEPLSDNKLDKSASERALDFMLGWFVEPLTSGKYPKSMRSLVGNRLPEFSQQQMKLVNGSFDFIGLNYYTSNYATHAPQLGTVKPNYNTDANTNLTTERNGIPIGPTVCVMTMSNYLATFD
ncbi:hypothetical protein LR48_Vigan05g196300 [Vigna angularis]|uniref:Beta-glucosidase n=1 Tax=Phaseolus angularis TaxID=3914 RepID=A0A0L9UNN1_PHAAN|nr:hypothetical protein LR48_Vigan05g196300 [Vigna angularis]